MAPTTVIANPIINSPFSEPSRHFFFADEGITNRIVPSRRLSAYFVPIAQPKKKGQQQQLTLGDWTADRIEENKTINFIRERVRLWREAGYPQVTARTRRLLEHWKRTDRFRRLFFCQIEALETLIYITEAAGKYGDQIIGNDLRKFAGGEQRRAVGPLGVRGNYRPVGRDGRDSRKGGTVGRGAGACVYGVMRL